jgi:hypothetical protein
MLLMAFMHNNSFAQKDVLFKAKFLPNKTYTTDMVNDMKMEMDFDVDLAKRKQMLDGGVKLPMQIDMLQEMSISTKTGALTADKSVPLAISYNKMGMTMKMQGKETKQPDQFVGMKIKAYATSDGKLEVDTIEGNTAEKVKAAIIKTISELMNLIKFLDKGMKIGDEFAQEIPMVVPAGASTMNLLIKVNYILKEISGNQAKFDYTQTIALNLGINQANSSATGSGTGKMTFNIPEQYITDSTGDTKMNLTMNTSGMNAKLDILIKSTHKAKIL